MIAPRHGHCVQVTRKFDLAAYVDSHVWYEDSFGKDWGSDPFLTGAEDDGNRQFRGSIVSQLQRPFPNHFQLLRPLLTDFAANALVHVVLMI